MNIEEYSKYTHFYSDKVPELLTKYITKCNYNSFLDVGCGDGSLLYALNKKGYFCNKTVYAIDLSQNRIDLCKKMNPDFNYFVNNACNMNNIDDGSINFLVSTQVIEHVPNDGDMVKEIERVINKDHNIVYISTVFKKWYGWYFYRCNNKWTLDPTHSREYTSDNQLLDILNKKNFYILESNKSLVWFSLLGLIALILRRIGYKNNITSNPFIKLFSIFKFPVFGYYIWEIVCTKK